MLVPFTYVTLLLLQYAKITKPELKFAFHFKDLNVTSGIVIDEMFKPFSLHCLEDAKNVQGKYQSR